MPTNKMPSKNRAAASMQGRKPLYGEARAAEMIDAADNFEKDFLSPTLGRLLTLINHAKAGVRILAAMQMGELVVNNMPLFTARTLAEATLAMKSRADLETDERVRRCLWHHLVQIVETAAAYGAACRAADAPE